MHRVQAFLFILVWLCVCRETKGMNACFANSKNLQFNRSLTVNGHQGIAGTLNWVNINILYLCGSLNEKLNTILSDDKLLNEPVHEAISSLHEAVCKATNGERISKQNSYKVIKVGEDFLQQGSLSDNNKIDLLQIYECLQDISSLKTRIQPHPWISVTGIKAKRNKAIMYNDSLNTNNNITTVKVSCLIPASAVNKVYQKLHETGHDSETVSSIFMFHSHNKLFPTTKDYAQFYVFSVKIQNQTLRDLEEPIRYNISLPAKEKGQKARFIRCGHYSIEKRDWMFKGCKFTDDSSNECDCTHTTNFATVMQVIPTTNQMVLNDFGTYACLLSAVSLALFLLIYLCNKKLRKRKVNQIHLHLCSSLFVFYLTFLSAVDKTENSASCTVTAFILQFSLLSSWGWMTVECVGLYRKIVMIFRDLTGGFIKKAALLVYLLSAAATGITFLVAQVFLYLEFKDWKQPKEDGKIYFSLYRSSKLCWLFQYSLYFGFLVPVFSMMSFNIVVSIITINKINTKTEIRKNRRENHNNLIVILTICTLLGTPWLLALPTVITTDETVNIIFSWLFSIANALQGVIIFLLFCVRPQDVRALWWKPRSITRIFHKKNKNWASDAKETTLATVSTNLNSSTVQLQMTSM